MSVIPPDPSLRPTAFSEDDFRQLLEVAPYPLVIVNESGMLTFVNAQAEVLFGYRHEELIGRAVETLIPDRYRDEHVCHRTRYMAAPRSRPMGSGIPLYGRRKDGSEFPAELSLSPLRSAGGLSVSAAILDLTERKRAEEERLRFESQVQQAQKLESLGVLTGGIAHDFNNLLTVILGNTSLARLQLTPESPAIAALHEIETAALRSSDLIRQMLAYAGKGRLQVQPVNLTHVIEEIAHLLQTVISKKVVLKFDFAADLPTVNADATQVRQVVMNLITNASDAIGEKSGVIALRTGVMFAERSYLTTTNIPADLPEGDYVYIEVADTGMGMDPATVNRIFDPFFTTKFTGRGLGLAAVLGIIRGHHGAIKIYTELSRGTTFKVLFPCHALPPIDAPLPDDAGPRWRGAGKILIVDDEEHVRVIAKRILEYQGFETESANDGRQAVARYKARPDDFVAVLTDLTMPHMSGDEVYRELRVIRPDVRVVLMSGYNEQEIENLFSGKGLAGFVQKPFRAEDLLSVIRRALTPPNGSGPQDPAPRHGPPA